MTEAEVMAQAQVYASAWSLVDGPLDTGSGLEQAEVEKVALQRMVSILVRERDDADRRAGAAERKMAAFQDSATTHQQWLDHAKLRAGYHRNVSFDIVFDDLLKERTERGTANTQHEEQGSSQAINPQGRGEYITGDIQC